jgi:hypothetical protein
MLDGAIKTCKWHVNVFCTVWLEMGLGLCKAVIVSLSTAAGDL